VKWLCGVTAGARVERKKISDFAAHVDLANFPLAVLATGTLVHQAMNTKEAHNAAYVTVRRINLQWPTNISDLNC
jgi:hypothetical protein